MRSLLKTTDRRRLELIELLVEENGWMTTTKLAEQLNSSVRNLKEDISFFKKTIPNMGIETGHMGVRIMMDQSTGIQEFYRIILKNNLIFQLLEEIFFNESYTIEGLAETLHTSTSTVYRVIDTINDYFLPFHCRVETNPCRFIGDEKFIRNFYRTYFKESSTILEWPFRSYDEKTINATFNRVLSVLSKGADVEDNFLDFAFYESIKLMVIVSVIRYQQGHLVETSQEETTLFKVLFNTLKLFVIPKDMKAIRGTPLTTEYIYQVFYPYFKKNAAFGVKAMEKLRKKNKTVDAAVTYLDDALNDFATTIDIEIESTDLMVALYGTVYLEEHDPNGMYILYNRNKMFAQMIHHQFPYVYHALYQFIVRFRQLLHREHDEDKVNYLIYTLFTSWENLLADLYTKYQRVSILVLSDGHYTHATTIKNLLTFELSNNVDIHIFKNRIISPDIIRETDHDLIVSTFKLPSLDNKGMVIIDHYLTDQDISRIEAMLTNIIQTKQLKLQT